MRMQANRHDIPIGRANAISRAELARLWGVSDRVARQMVARMRAEAGGDGCAILSTSRQPAGYWRSSDPGEIQGFILETEARARHTFAALGDARRVLRVLEAQHEYGQRLDGRERI